MTNSEKPFTVPLLWRVRAKASHPRRVFWGAVAEVQELSRKMRRESGAWLKACGDELRSQAQAAADGWKSAYLMKRAYAAIIEACRRVHGVELYDVQVLVGVLLGRGFVVEMETGEGKTFSAALPGFLFSLAGRGVHVATPNSYLATRDFELLRPVYELLGCSAGLLADGVALAAKRAAYASHITYGTGYEFGFDYLREQLESIKRKHVALGDRMSAALIGSANEQSQPISRGFAIVDEVDSVLIDEACTPLVLSGSPGPAALQDRVYREALQAAREMRPDDDFGVDLQRRSIWLTDAGRARCYQNVPRGLARLSRPWVDYVEQALHAVHLLRRDVDYVISGDGVVLVDAMTGRLCADRTWRDGLHQMIEVKEGLQPSAERSVAAQITRQRYFRQYKLLCGMSGTVQDAASEFYQTYGLRAAIVPPRQPSPRRALAPRFYSTAEAKYADVVRSIRELHATGRPVLIGSRNIENSQRLAASLALAGVPFQLLNGKQTADEAAIIAQAGARGAVTIATNMAGRGTDIRLGAGVAELGGLHLVGLEHNDSLRVDRQLIGRVARQGNPGSYQFFASAEDQLIRTHARRLQARLARESDARGHVKSDFSRQVLRAQRRAEGVAFGQRLGLARADRWRTEDLAELVQ
jgi:preprotein translocase subunit SecA